jgi:hypothetical protein
MKPSICAYCGKPLVQPAGRGRPRRYCSRKCQRAAAYRRPMPPVSHLDRSDPRVDRFLKDCGL